MHRYICLLLIFFHFWVSSAASESFSLNVNESIVLSKQALALQNCILAERDHDFFHLLESIDFAERRISLKDGSYWKMGYWYKSDIQNWKIGQRLKISQHSKSYANDVRIENIDDGSVAWGELEKKPIHMSWIMRIFDSLSNSTPGETVIVNSGFIFKGKGCFWKARDPLFIFHNNEGKEGIYDLWNLKTNELVEEWSLVGDENKGSPESIFNLELFLNKNVLGQSEAISAIASAVLRSQAGLNDSLLPIGVFLFLGPSGVGKTELAKVLGNQLFKNKQSLIRFDMSHFIEPHSIARLVGSPPGYVNHEEGGQLTEALRFLPNRLILLDEIEKAHPSVRKFFLPIFDEGWIKDAKNRIIPCNRAIFILTSNLCAKEIIDLYDRGYSAEEIKNFLEPELIQHLSPELYNRVTTLVFRPITRDLMRGLTDLMLKEVVDRFNLIKKIHLQIEESVKEYLIENGYHPSLGARPLKRLIQEKLVTFLSYVIIKEALPEGSTIKVGYDNEHFVINFV